MSMRLNPQGHRSKFSTEVSFVKFKNSTQSEVFVIWFDYCGRRVLYVSLKSGQYIDMNTFVSHPWTCEKSNSGDRLNSNLNTTFYPQENHEGRQIVNITTPMYSLKERSLQVVRDSFTINNENDLVGLELPKPLDSELRFLLTKKYCSQIHNENLMAEAGSIAATIVGPNSHSCSFTSSKAAEFISYVRD